MIFVIDNYDSFTYNLVQYLGEMGEEVVVYRNDKISPDQIEEMSPDRIIISPGPGRPSDAGVSTDVIKKFEGKVPLLGVCLGHQCIGEVYGAEIVRAEKIMHGKTSLIYHDEGDMFAGVKSPFTATRYHSLLIEPGSLKTPLKISAWTEQDEIMGVSHEFSPVFGVQFHPESILTEDGKRILENFVRFEWRR